MPLVNLKNCEINANGFSQDDKKKFLKLFEEYHCDLGRVCDIVGINPATYYNHLDADPNFALEVRMLKRELSWSLVPRQVERALANSPTDAIWLQKNLNHLEFNADRPTMTGGDRVVIIQINSAQAMRESSTTNELVDYVSPPTGEQAPTETSLKTYKHGRVRQSPARKKQLAYERAWRAAHPNYGRQWRASRKAKLSQMSDNTHNVKLEDCPKVSNDKKLEQSHQKSRDSMDQI